MSDTTTFQLSLVEESKKLSVPIKTAEELIAEYEPFAVALREKIYEVSKIEKLTPGAARAVRLATVKIRTGCDKRRKELKADILSRGRAVDGLCSLIEMSAVKMEKQMEDIEKEAERIEGARVKALAEDRAARLRQFCDPSLYDLGRMTDQAFDGLLEGQRLAHEKREADRIAAEKAEAERIAKVKAEAEAAEKRRQEELAAAKEAARIAHEKAKAEAVARAKAEAEAAEIAMVAREKALEEKRKADAILAAERAARAKAEAEAAAKAKAEAEPAAKAKAEADAAEAKRKAAAAPDAQKIRDFADAIGLAVPTLSDASKDQQQKIHDQVGKMTAWLHTIARNMA